MKATKAKSERPAFYLSPDQAADYMNVSRSTLDRWRKSGLITCARIGRRMIRYRRPDLDAMMKDHMIRVDLDEGA